MGEFLNALPSERRYAQTVLVFTGINVLQIVGGFFKMSRNCGQHLVKNGLKNGPQPRKRTNFPAFPNLMIGMEES